MSSIWEDEWEDYELNEYEFEQWLDSVNESGDPSRDKEYYDKEMNKQVNWPEVAVNSENYSMIVSNN